LENEEISGRDGHASYPAPKPDMVAKYGVDLIELNSWELSAMLA
jgi:hypothetical protein